MQWTGMCKQIDWILYEHVLSIKHVDRFRIILTERDLSQAQKIDFYLSLITEIKVHHTHASQISINSVRNSCAFWVCDQILSRKMAAFCVVAPCSPVKVYRRFRGACWVIALMVAAVSTSETSINFYQNIGTKTQRQPSSYSPPWEPEISPDITYIIFFIIKHKRGFL
jgi:hypothetical protein